MSLSNPMHRSATGSNTKRDDKKLERKWSEIQTEKKAYIQRLQQEEESRKLLKDWPWELTDDDKELPF